VVQRWSLWIPTLAVFAVLAANARVDHYFRDEFYYLACTHHLAWGYVDHPPLSIAILWLVRHIAGDSLIALRIPAAAAAAASIWLTGSTARRLGATTYGQLLAMTAAAIAPMLLGIATVYSMNVFDVLLWTLIARLLLDAIDMPTNRRWATLGIVIGLGLLNKISVLWLGGGIAVGLVLTPARRLLLTRGPWIAVAIALGMFLPHIIWQITHGWPTLEFIRNASGQKMRTNTPFSFLSEITLAMQPPTLPLWAGGLGLLLATRGRSSPRVLGIAIVFVTVLLVANRTSRTAYLAPVFPALFAAGGVLWERWLTHRVLRAAAIVVLAAAGALSLPLAVPLLPADGYVRYSRALGMAPSTDEKQQLGRLPQFFADRQGWDRFAAQIAAAWDRLTSDERTTAAVVTGNYGEAGAIELLDRSSAVRVVSGHNNYWLWGPDGATGDVLIVLSREPDRLRELFASVERVGETECGDCMPYENRLGIYICRGLRGSLRDHWPAMKHYI
jgi:4-amino-4-deoxy-L-arabinose transferase-like glycosyltransferase